MRVLVYIAIVTQALLIQLTHKQEGVVSLDRFPKKPCKYCKRTGHFPYDCNLNPKKALKRVAGLKRSSINKAGKQTKQWFITRATWIRKHPPDEDGFWYCYLRIHPWCPIKLTIETLTLDHVVSRTRDPKKRFSQNNLKPACIYCNEMKGSKSLDEVRKLANVSNAEKNQDKGN